MIARRSLFAAAFALAAGAALSPAAADEAWPFDMKAFKAAQAEGKPILIEVFAPWCSTCRRQQPIVAALSKKPEFAGLEVYTIDFDNQKDALRALRVTSQSTLITFKGAKETGRSVGVTDPKAIEDLIRLAF